LPPKTQSKREEADEAVEVTGGLPARVTQVRYSTLNLITIFGKGTDSRDVLVPLVDWRMSGAKADDGKELAPSDTGVELSSHLLTLDNLAFLLQDIGFDVREAVRLLAIQARGDATALMSRMQYTATMLQRASQHFSVAADTIIVEILKGECVTKDGE
jgi:hypothetical protein